MLDYAVRLSTFGSVPVRMAPSALMDDFFQAHSGDTESMAVHQIPA
jgi:hypothetical protein